MNVHNNSVKELTLLFLSYINPTNEIPPCLYISNSINPPLMPSEFHIVSLPQPFGNPKAVHGIGMDIFWNRPFSDNPDLLCSKFMQG